MNVFSFLLNLEVLICGCCWSLASIGSDNSFFTVTAKDVDNNGPENSFNTNLTGLIRLQSQGESPDTATAYAIMYILIVGYTAVFTFMYFKRFLYKSSIVCC